MNYYTIDIKSIPTNAEGTLSFFEGERDIPFPIKRIYYIHHVSAGVKRGAHAHKTLRQLLFCPYGSVTLVLSDGKTKEEVVLDNPGTGLVLEPGLWREMVWNIDNSVLCVAASEYYDKDDYIRDYDEYLAYIKSKEEK